MTNEGLWLWSAILTKGDQEHLVYAMLAPAEGCRMAPWHEERALGDTARLVMQEAMLAPEAAASVLSALDQSLIDLRPSGAKLAPVQILARRETIEDALGDTAARMIAHYTLPDIGTILPEDVRFAEILEILHQELNLPFPTRFFTHFGNLDMITFEASPQNALINLSVERSREEMAFVVRRREPLLDREARAHLVTKAGEETLVDRLLLLPAGEERVATPLPLETGSFAFTMFDDADGSVCYRETQSLTKSITMRSHIRSAEIALDDPFTQRMKGAPHAVRAKISKRQDHSSSEDVISATSRHIEAQASALATRLERERRGHLDRFFERTLEGEASAVAHLRTLLDDAAISRAILVDPFFGEDAFTRLVMRLGNTGLDLTVVTSWTTTDPETALPLADNDLVAMDENVRRLRRILGAARELVAPRLSVLNLTCGTKAAFHDRYLVLQPHEGNSTVYLLSNSINGMAVHWPFCLSAVKGMAAKHIEDYVEGLAEGRNITGSREIGVNFRWPET